MAFLIIERGNDTGKRIALTSFPITIGREPKSSIVLNDTEISRTHFRIKQRGRLYILEDLDSKNGTYVNGDKVINSTLQNRDKILVGSTEFMFLASEPNIQIMNEIISYDKDIVEDLGLHGPIEIEPDSKSENFKPIRFNLTNLSNLVSKDIKVVKQVHEYHSNMLVIDDLTEACKTMLKNIGHILPKASRAAVFIWFESSRKLIPFASKNYADISQAFLLSRRALEDAITRQQGISLPTNLKTTETGRNRVILPMLRNDEAICLVHIENDNPRYEFEEKKLAVVQTLLNKSSAIFESMLLRRELDSWLVGMIETMIATVEAKDTYTSGHSERVCRYSMAIADELRLNKDIKRLLMISSLCHDIGKIGIPDYILKKTSHLNAEEYAEMKLHPTIGADIITHMPNANRFISGVKYHHEKWDGTGYPDGLKGEDIPFFGRIIAIADGFDAMVSGRAYSGFMNQPEAIEKLSEESKDLYDPEIFKAFIKAHENGSLTLKTSTQNNMPSEEKNNRTSEYSIALSSRPKKTK